MRPIVMLDVPAESFSVLECSSAPAHLQTRAVAQQERPPMRWPPAAADVERPGVRAAAPAAARREPCSAPSASRSASCEVLQARTALLFAGQQEWPGWPPMALPALANSPAASLRSGAFAPAQRQQARLMPASAEQREAS